MSKMGLCSRSDKRHNSLLHPSPQQSRLNYLLKREEALLTCWISVRYLAVLSVILKYSQSFALPVGLPPRSPCSATKRDSSVIALPPLIYTSPWSLSTQDVAAEKRLSIVVICCNHQTHLCPRNAKDVCCQGSETLTSPLAALSETAI